ncbi:MAG: flagellar basal body-associated protein FliL [Variovorax sp.]|nr:MAG: flagellar basal body-associated protein FliL [Variovorax sp.]
MATSPPIATPIARSPRLVIGLLIAFGVCVVVAAALAYVVSTRGLPASVPAPAVAQKPIFITLEPLTVNLQSDGRGRFLHVGVSLKVRNEHAKAQITEFMPELRSRVLLLLSNRQPESLLSTEDKSRLAEEIRTELNRPLGAGLAPQDIAGVSFNTFVVQ